MEIIATLPHLSYLPDRGAAVDRTDRAQAGQVVQGRLSPQCQDTRACYPAALDALQQAEVFVCRLFCIAGFFL